MTHQGIFNEEVVVAKVTGLNIGTQSTSDGTQPTDENCINIPILKDLVEIGLLKSAGMTDPDGN
jgi:hypothetical protein